MLSLEQRLDKVEGSIKKPSFRQNKGLGNEVGYGGQFRPPGRGAENPVHFA